MALPAETRRLYWERFGAWYENRRQYLHAMAAYRQSGDFDALLRVVREDAGILLASLKPSEVLKALEQCPAEIMKAHPFALLVLMRRMFTWRQIPKMLELKELLLNAIAEHPELPADERGNLLGECDLIMSFLCYNDISAPGMDITLNEQFRERKGGDLTDPAVFRKHFAARNADGQPADELVTPQLRALVRRLEEFANNGKVGGLVLRGGELTLLFVDAVSNQPPTL